MARKAVSALFFDRYPPYPAALRRRGRRTRKTVGQSEVTGCATTRRSSARARRAWPRQFFLPARACACAWSNAASHAGGRLVAREFHPGFRASPFVDDIVEIPPQLFGTLDLARHGAVIAPPRISRAVWPDRRHELTLGESGEAAALLALSAERRAQIAARAEGAAKTAPRAAAVPALRRRALAGRGLGDG